MMRFCRLERTIRGTCSYTTCSPASSSSTSFSSSIDYLLRLVHISSESKSLRLIQESHSHAITTGILTRAIHLATKLISAYSASKRPCQSKLVFDSIAEKDIYAWNSLINGFVKNHFYNEAFTTIVEMCRADVLPDGYTLASVSKAAAESRELCHGKLSHSMSVRVGLIDDTVLVNSLLSMYSKCGEFMDAKKLFEEMPERSVSSWNVLITGLASLSDRSSGIDVWDAMKCMHSEGIKPDAFTISSVLPLCGDNTLKFNHGRELHGYILRNKLDLMCNSDAHLGCCLIDMYSRNDMLDSGRYVFNQMQCRNVFVWTAMLNGCVRNRNPEEALKLFCHMQLKDGIKPNRVSIVSILPASSMFAGLVSVKQIHGFVIRNSMGNEVSVTNALIDAYCKSGNIAYARQIFENAADRDAISWSAMISGYGIHGKGEEAVVLYDEMLLHGIKPDNITTVGILSACTRSGLHEKGLSIYDKLVKDYKIEPSVEICACVVDMLGRSNQLEHALSFITRMRVEAGPSIWGALVNASIIHGNDEMRELAYSYLIELEPGNPSNYISVSNVHATSNRWNLVAGVRRMMREKGLRKEPGYSWIVIDGTTNCFYVADRVHPSSSTIYEMLNSINLVMKGIVASSDSET
ncbi:hypothetical protein SAY86_003000 [Trapa natans]|uniref:Pentatricopeptide repeat-containing protein n=1 Tax=Trapa natans TaxID=22666 RepID=A0AAN7LH73_TRANT|nr:hypothetical protein SAY86_003000 [Trapa natans]